MSTSSPTFLDMKCGRLDKQYRMALPPSATPGTVLFIAMVGHRYLEWTDDQSAVMPTAPWVVVRSEHRITFDLHLKLVFDRFSTAPGTSLVSRGFQVGSARWFQTTDRSFFHVVPAAVLKARDVIPYAHGPTPLSASPDGGLR